MSEHSENAISASGGSFFTAAAWYGFLVPLITSVIWVFVAAATDGRLGAAFLLAFWVVVTGFGSSLVGSIGALRRGRRRIVWLALIGIVANLVLGCLSLLYWSMLQTWHG